MAAQEVRLNFTIEIDGGVGLENAAEITRAGCELLVAGSSVFHTPNAGQAFVDLQRAAREGTLVRV